MRAEPGRLRVRSLAARSLTAVILAAFAALVALPLQAQMPDISDDATLRALTIEGTTGGETIALSPAFTSETTAYTASVANRIDEVKLTATKNEVNATVAITDDPFHLMPNEAELDLSVGANTLTVTAEDDTTILIYTITVTRAAAPPAPTDCPAGNDWCTTMTLGYGKTTASVSETEEFGYLSSSNFGDLGSTTFSYGGTSYSVSNIFRSKTIRKSDSVVQVDQLTLLVNPALPDDTVFQLGSRTFTVDTDSEGTSTPGQELWDIKDNPLSWTAGQHVTVSLELSTDSTDATLSALTVNDGTNDLTLTPTFDSDTYTYAANVDNAVTTVTLTATVSHTSATVSAVTLDGSAIADTDFTDGITVPSLILGDNAIVVTVTSEDTTTTQTYTITVTRAMAPTEIPAGWVLIPRGLRTGDKFRLLFLSSTKRNADTSVIGTFNTFVQGLAAAGHTDIQGYSDGFKVVGCTGAVDARDNTATTYTTSDKGVPIYWLNGAKVADEYEDFYDGSWDEEANDKNESGTNGPDTSNSDNYPFPAASATAPRRAHRLYPRHSAMTKSASVAPTRHKPETAPSAAPAPLALPESSSKDRCMAFRSFSRWLPPPMTRS